MKLTHVHRISTTSKLTGHPLYKEAKQGNPEAAQTVVQEIIPVKNQFRYLNGFVCPVLKQNGNQIPMALARIMVSHSNLILDDSIFLQHASHGSSMTERLYYQPSFSGIVKPADYVIVDDVYTTGKTLKSLKNYIESKGGNVISAWCIGSGPSLEFEPKRMLLWLLTAKFPTINRYFDLNELTSPQIHYLLRLSSLNKLWMIHADNQLSLMMA
jgi:hypothetical protein